MKRYLGSGFQGSTYCWKVNIQFNLIIEWWLISDQIAVRTGNGKSGELANWWHHCRKSCGNPEVATIWVMCIFIRIELQQLREWWIYAPMLCWLKNNTTNHANHSSASFAQVPILLHVHSIWVLSQGHAEGLPWLSPIRWWLLYHICFQDSGCGSGSRSKEGVSWTWSTCYCTTSCLKYIKINTNQIKPNPDFQSKYEKTMWTWRLVTHSGWRAGDFVWLMESDIFCYQVKRMPSICCDNHVDMFWLSKNVLAGAMTYCWNKCWGAISACHHDLNLLKTWRSHKIARLSLY